jgi:hypothetical protein
MGRSSVALVELGYGWAYRVLDARHFGVPQRRRRVFIVAFGAGTGLGADGAAEVLSVGSRCRRHPPTGIEAGEDAADGARPALTSLARSSAPPASDTTRTSTPSSPTSPTVRPRSGMPQGWNANLASVRRLTPVECEMLHGWPPGWTIVPRTGRAGRRRECRRSSRHRRAPAHLWPSAGEEAVQRAARRLRGLPPKEVLRRGVRELEACRSLEAGGAAEGGPLPGADAGDEDGLRELRQDDRARRASPEPRPARQPAGEPGACSVGAVICGSRYAMGSHSDVAWSPRGMGRGSSRVAHAQQRRQRRRLPNRARRAPRRLREGARRNPPTTSRRGPERMSPRPSTTSTPGMPEPSRSPIGRGGVSD